MLADVCEFRCDPRRVFRGGGGSWTTGEVDERVGFAFVAGCGEDEDVQTDLPAFLCGAVFVDLERATLCGACNVRDLAVFQDNLLGAVLTNRACGLERRNYCQAHEKKFSDHLCSS